MPIYAYRGNAAFIEAIEPRLAKAGFTREGEIELADFVVTFSTTMTELEELYFGEDGFVGSMKPGACAIDLSATTPNFAYEINAVLTISDLGMVVAPLMVKNQVSPDAFERSNIACYAAGDDVWIEAAFPLLDAIFGRIDRLHSPVLVQLARAANTLQKVSEVVSAIESQTLLESSRLTISSADIEGFTIGATSPEAYFVLQAINEKRFESPFTVEMLMSELSAAIMAADDNDMIIPQAEAAFHLLELLAIIGGSQKSPAALDLVYGNLDEQTCKEYGLDWSRAEGLYHDEHDHDHDILDQLDGLSYGEDFADEMYEDDLTGFDYSTN